VWAGEEDAALGLCMYSNRCFLLLLWPVAPTAHTMDPRRCAQGLRWSQEPWDPAPCLTAVGSMFSCDARGTGDSRQTLAVSPSHPQCESQEVLMTKWLLQSWCPMHTTHLPEIHEICNFIFI
jgi:hypothetical protein